MKYPSEQAQRSLRYSFWDGLFASAMTGFTQDYLTPFLLAIGGSVRAVGLLNALPNLFVSFVQFRAADLVERWRSRKRVFVTFVFIQALMLLPMMAIAWRGGAAPFAFIFCAVLFAGLGAVATPAYGSVMSDLVGDDRRGAYFGWRNKVLGFVMIGLSFLAGAFLTRMKQVDLFFGFYLLFAAAFVFRLISCFFLTRMEEPQLSFEKEHQFTFWMFIRRFRESNFAKFVLFVAAMNFSVMLASPFFAVLMLKDLNFSYFQYSCLAVTATATIYLSMGRWGRHADRVGNLRVMFFVAPLIGCVPLLWVFCLHPVYLFFAQLFSGFVWAGFNLCATNFIYDAVVPEKRTRCIAYFNVLSGLALFLGALLGGWMLPHLPPVFGHRILSLFIISAVLRLAVGFIFPRFVNEVRPVSKAGSGELFFSVIGVRPIAGVERGSLRV